MYLSDGLAEGRVRIPADELEHLRPPSCPSRQLDR